MNRLPASAVILMLIGMSLIPTGDSAAKLLTDHAGVSSLLAAWSRFALGLVLLSLLLWRLPPLHLLQDWRVWLRGGLIAGGIASILTALRTEQLADVYGAFFVGPLVSYALSVWLLGERFELRRAGLAGLGFVGVLLVVRPGFGLGIAPGSGSAMGPGIGLGFAVLAGVLYGAFLTASRWLAPIAGPRDLLLSQLCVGTLLLLPFSVTNIPPMTAEIAGLTTLSALASGLGNLCLALAYRRAEASMLAPLVYTQLIAAAGLGWLVFGAVPEVMTGIGLGVLLLSGLGAALLRRR